MIVVWRVTERCNLGCGFCAYDRAVARPRRDADPDLVLAFGRTLGEWARATGERALLSWLGGEPLLWPALFEVGAALRREGDIELSVTTNGTTLEAAAVREHLLAEYAEDTFSIDAPGAEFDALRGWPGGFARLARGVAVLAGAKRERGAGPRLRCNVVLMRETIAGFERLCEELARLGIEEVTFNQLGGNDRPEFAALHRLLPEQVERFAGGFGALRARLGERGLTVLGGAGYLGRIGATSRGEALPVADCRPGESFWFVDEQGRLGPCSFTATEAGIDVRELRCAADLNALPQRLAARRREVNPRPCLDCHATQLTGKFER